MTQQYAQEYTQDYSQGQRQTPASVNSLLVADCGSVFTKVSLFGLVEGQYRLIARAEAQTTLQPPHADVTEGIIHATHRIEQITGRRFLEQNQLISPEEEDGNGVDAFITTVSAASPMRIVVMGAVDASLEALARQAASGLYAETEAIASPSFLAATAQRNVPNGQNAQGGQGRTQWSQEQFQQEWGRQLEHIRAFQPQAALIVGMADGPGGPTPLQEACQLLINMTKAQKAAGESDTRNAASCEVLYAGAPQYNDAVRKLLYGVANVTRVDSLVSQEQLESVSVAMGALQEREALQRIPGYEQLRSWSSAVPIATATSLSSLVRFLSQHYAMNVTTVDVGGSTTTVLLAGERGEFLPKVNTGIGVGAGAGAILQQAGVRRIARWLPFTIAEDELRQYALNRMLHPQAIPTETRELQILHAFAREAMSLTLESLYPSIDERPNTDLILATGGILAHAPNYNQVALMLLDAIQPKGVTSLVLDRTMLVSQLGAVATIAPIAAVQVNENDAVTYRLGTCVVPYGQMTPGQVAVRVGVEYSNGRQQEIDVLAGTSRVIPLSMQEQALLTLFPAPGVDVGLGPGERARAAEEIDGGLVGLIIDARGRPLLMPHDETERQARIRQWMQAMEM